VILHGATRQNVIAVPQVAVMDGPQGKFVYVVGKDKEGKDVATPRPVVVGDWVDANRSNQWVIESGLKPGDPVIVNGIAKVMPGAPVKVAAAGAAEPGKTAAAEPAKTGAEPAKAAAEGAKSTAETAKTGAEPAKSPPAPAKSAAAAKQ
jgi:membrane fusion protein (multidrug efflux system)